ncbi:hypothetical protein DOY81_005338 [Sarcophaga bullata]|nr:hypothetical protein DOY81_005338 [Sarcophaga bullata]
MLVFLANCLAMPTDLSNTEEEAQAQAVVTETLLQIEENIATETPMKAGETKQEKESAREVEKSTEIVPESSRNVEVEDDYIVKDDAEKWKDFETNFNLLEERLPDLTAEEMHEISKEDAIPLNFLKSFDAESELVQAEKPKPKENTAPIYITVPIVINTHSNLPIMLSIGGQNVPLNGGVEVTDAAILVPANVKQSTVSSLARPTSVFNKVMDYGKITVTRRPTNRHRSNIRKRIYARHHNHEVQEFEY